MSLNRDFIKSENFSKGFPRMTDIKRREFFMKEIIQDLRRIRDKIESWDDPTMPELDRDHLGKVHHCIEECIDEICIFYSKAAPLTSQSSRPDITDAKCTGCTITDIKEDCPVHVPLISGD